MTRTTVLSALQTDGDDPGFILNPNGVGDDAVIERRGLHAYGHFERAGTHVVRLHASPIPDYGGAGISAVGLKFEMPEEGYLTYWAAVAAQPSNIQWIGQGGPQDGQGQGQNSSQPTDWQQFYLPLPAGPVAAVWQLYSFSDADTSARTMWVSKIEAFYGDEPLGQGPFISGSEEDPNTTIVRLFGFDDATIADGVTLGTGVDIVRRTSTNDPDFSHTDHDSAPGAFMAQFAPGGITRLDLDFTVTADPRSYLVAAISASPQSTSVRFQEFHDDDLWNDLTTNDQWVRFEESFDPGTWNANFRAPDGVTARMSRARLVYPGPDSTMDVSESAVTEQPDDGAGGDSGGGSTLPTGAYKRSEYVRHKGGLYIARVDGPTTEPGPGDSDDWFEMVAQPPASSVPNPYAAAVRATVGDEQSPYADGEEGLWIVLNDDRSAVVDLRWQSAT